MLSNNHVGEKASNRRKNIFRFENFEHFENLCICLTTFLVYTFLNGLASRSSWETSLTFSEARESPKLPHHITHLGLRLSSPEKIAVQARAEITENIMNDRSMEGNSFENKTLLSVGVENTYRTRQNASRHKRKCGNRSECIYKALDVDIQVSILKIEPESSFFK